MRLAFAGLLGIGYISPMLIVAQTATDTSASGVVWMTGGTVLTLAGVLYKFMTARIAKLESQVDELTKAAERRADEDRKLLIPLLSRSVEAQSAYLKRRLDAEQET